MDPHSWSRIRELFAAAVLLDPEERSAFLNDNCGEDAALRREVESLLDHDLEAGDHGDAIGEAVRAEARGVAGTGDGRGTQTAPAPDPLVGQRVGQIRVLQLLGRGGMGKVYVGFDETLQRRVALKAIRARHRLAAGSRARFLREARILSQLEHPNICRIHNYIEGDESDFLVLELIEGGDLAEAIAEGLEPAQKMKVAIQIAAVLEAAHGQGVVHRDLKPQNVMVTPEGEAKVLDFGLARSGEPAPSESTGPEPTGPEPPELDAPEPVAAPDGRTLAIPDESSADTALMPELGGPEAGREPSVRTRRGQLVGTPVFMSPEQASGEEVTTASDMYSFALLLQALFTGASPYPAGLDSVEILSRARRAETLPATGVDKDLAALIGRMKSAAPAARPTAVEALERLRWVRGKPKRRLRRLIAAAVLALLALGGAKYTFDLKVARDEATRRRDQAEDLIGFMIGDLRSKLAPVNRLEVLDTIGDKALDYFAAVPAAELTSKELLFRSQTLSQIGQVRMDQGDLAAALEAFNESLGLARDLTEREPDNGDWLAWLGAAHFWVGFVDWKRSDLEGALGSYRAYLDVSRELVERDPENLDWQLELSYAHNNIGSVLSAAGNLAAAADEFRSSVDIKRRLVSEQPENRQWQTDLAGSHVWLGRALLSSGDLEGALHEYQANLEILQELVAAEPANTRRQWLLGIAHEKIGWVLEITGRLDEALPRYEEYFEINQALVEHDGENSTWQRELAVAHTRVGNALVDLGESKQGQERLRAAEAILERLIAIDASNTNWKWELAHARTGLANVLWQRGLAKEALQKAAEATEISRAILEDNPGDSTMPRLYSHSLLALGEVHLQLERGDEAAAAFSRALEAIERANGESSDPQHGATRAQALLRLGRIEEARPIVAKLHRQGFRRRAFERLCRDMGVWP
ncbi:MAG: protein kinase [bacterium]|nr:protein kinase [bacterium]